MSHHTPSKPPWCAIYINAHNPLILTPALEQKEYTVPLEH